MMRRIGSITEASVSWCLFMVLVLTAAFAGSVLSYLLRNQFYLLVSCRLSPLWSFQEPLCI